MIVAARSACRRAPCRLGAALVALACLLAVVLVGGPARADSADEAEGRARAIEQRVSEIEQRLQQALGAYDVALGGLAGAVNSNVAADVALGQAADAATAAAQIAGARVRAIYRSGGPLALYATVLDGGNPGDVLARAQVVQRVVIDDKAAAASGQRDLIGATVRAREARAAANDRARQAATVGTAARNVQRLLLEEQALLKEARATATRLREQERALEAAQAAYATITSTRARDLSPIGIPAPFGDLYHAAATTCPGMSWTLLAAVGQVETGHGRNKNVSTAGAMGPMQFMPATFAAYAVDGDGDGDKDILDPADSVFTAARYLCANGAGRGNVAGALWRYNHADWYVQMVMRLAAKYAAADAT